MPISLTAKTINAVDYRIVIDRDPDCCPVCKIAVRPLRQQTIVITSGKNAQLTYRCPRELCASLFIGEYFHVGSSDYYFKRTFPNTFTAHKASEEVDEISKAFSVIYNQALESESLGLTEIAGMGFRKALEFLIKDYCISKNPEKAESIKKTFLGPCIENFVSDPNIKRCATRATWLGNDETHYIRQYTDHDITDLKRLVRLTESWITSELMTEKYEASLTKPSK